jgi:hypothetical protein
LADEIKPKYNPKTGKRYKPRKSKKDGACYVKQDENGLPEGFDKDGNKLWSLNFNFLDDETKKKLSEGLPVADRAERPIKYIYVLNERMEKVLVPTGFDLKRLPKFGDGRACVGNILEYNPVSAANICILVSEGYSLNEIGRMTGMPSAGTMFNWMANNKEFKEAYEEARRQRAEYYHDKIHEIAHTVKESNSKSKNVAFSAFKHLASVNDPEKHGSRTKIVGDPNAPVGIIVDTGIHREEKKPEVIDVTPEKKNED